MKAPRISRVIIVFQSILLLICLGFLGYFILLSFVVKWEAQDYAFQAGYDEALRNYLRQRPSIYEIKLFTYGDDSGPIPTDGTVVPANKREHGLPVLYYMVGKKWSRTRLEIKQKFVDSYNEQMREYFEHPETYDQYGLRIWESPYYTTNSI